MDKNPLDAAWILGTQQRPASEDVAWKYSQALPGFVRRIHVADDEKQKGVAPRKRVPRRQDAGSDLVEALRHGLAVLECWGRNDIWLTNSEVAARSGLTRTSVTRLTSVLVSLGYLACDTQRRGRFRLTISTLSLGYSSALTAPIVSSARAELSKLSVELDLYTALSIRKADKVLILENVAAPRCPDAVDMDVGGLLPLCRTASGLAALVAVQEPESSKLMEQLERHYGRRWSAIESHVARARREYVQFGYCTSVAALSPRVAAVAAPIVSTSTNDVFVLACAMSTDDFHVDKVQRAIAPRLLAVTQSLGRNDATGC